MQSIARRSSFVLYTGLLLLLSTGWSLSQAAQWQVSNHGLDSNSCSSNDPCRSISEAIRKAKAGDTIFVFTRVYGDLNQNGVLENRARKPGRSVTAAIVSSRSTRP